METELKYALRSEEQIDRIFNDPVLLRYMGDDEQEMKPMSAVYYDTEDRALSERYITFRIRKEGDRYVATMKWNGSVENGLSRREELNVPLSAEEAASPSLGIFEQSDIGDVLAEAAAGKTLVPVMEMDFVRRSVRLDTGSSISELSADIGDISAGGQKAPILELELELYAGDEDDMLRFGAEIAERYGLKAENSSKFARGFALLSDGSSI